MCGEKIARNSVRCEHCGEEVDQRSRASDQKAPHRGVMILIFGILGIVCCFPFGIAAWVMANTDLREIDAGRMDESGRGLTQAGKVVGIVSCALAALGILAQIIIVIVSALNQPNGF